MNIEERAQEIEESMQAFRKSEYRKAEILPELLQLQRESAAQVFPNEAENPDNIHMMEVYNQLKAMNKECGYMLSAEVNKMNKPCWSINNQIRALISGNQGERKAAYTIENRLHCLFRTLQNLELEIDGQKTEIDQLVFTSRGIFIIEVKNSRKDMYISSAGNYYKVSEDREKKDCNLLEKMKLRENLVHAVLIGSKYEDAPITGIVVNTYDTVEIHNQCPELKTCFLYRMPELIEGSKNRSIYTVTDMQNMADILKAAESRSVYPAGIDVNQFRHDFALLVAKLEAAKEHPEMFAQPTEKAVEPASEAKTRKAEDPVPVKQETCAEPAPEQKVCQTSYREPELNHNRPKQMQTRAKEASQTIARISQVAGAVTIPWMVMGAVCLVAGRMNR